VFGDPFLVVLDEPNANLDADGENALGRAILTLRRQQCIVIVISHRPSALAALDMAMVLYEGKAIAFGSRDQIFARIHRPPAQPVPTPHAMAMPSAKTVHRAAVAEQV
jgi:ABC-type protease/lipase transport system fused ATPase/permease subunit